MCLPILKANDNSCILLFKMGMAQQIHTSSALLIQLKFDLLPEFTNHIIYNHF